MGHRHSVEKIRSLRRRRKSSSSKSEAAANDSRRRKHKAENCEIRAGLLKETEIKYIQTSWPHIELELVDILTEAFLTLFSEHPNIKEKFFKTYYNGNKSGGGHVEGNARNNGRANAAPNTLTVAAGDLLQRHIPKVVRAIAKAANNVDDLERKTADYFQIVGKLHYQNGIHLVDMGLLGPYVVSSAVVRLPSHLRERGHQEAWLRFFSALNELMARGYPEIEFRLTMREKTILRSSFSVVKAAPGGEAAILKLFQTYCSSSSSSSSSSARKGRARLALEEDELALAQAMENHGLLLLKMVDEVLAEIDDESRFRAYLTAVGAFHAKAGVRRQHLDVMGPFFCQTIRPVLQTEARWNGEMRQTWSRFFRIITYYMKKGYDVSPCQDLEKAKKEEAATTSSETPPALRFLSASPQPTHPQRGCSSQSQEPRRVSVGEIQERRFVANRLPPAHCHAFNGHHRHNEARLSLTSLCVVNDIHDYGSPKRQARNQHLTPYDHHLHIQHPRCAVGRQLSRSEFDLRRSSTGSQSGIGFFFSTSSKVVNSTSGCKSAILIMANEAAAKAEKDAKAKRRNSLHQLIGLATKPCAAVLSSKDTLATPTGKSRPRSKSTTLADHLAVRQ